MDIETSCPGPALPELAAKEVWEEAELVNQHGRGIVVGGWYLFWLGTALLSSWSLQGDAH